MREWFEKHAESIVHYKYSGKDNSPVYHHFMKPIAAFCCKFVPHAITPNMLTFSGAYCQTFAFLLMMFGESAVSYPTRCLICAICVWLNTTLDNMDGIHARNTGRSSTSGMIVDHIADSFVVAITPVTISMVLGLPLTSLFSMFGATIVTINMTFAVYAQHKTGLFELPFPNGSTEGPITVVIGCILPFFIPGFFDTTLLSYAGNLISFRFAFFNINNVLCIFLALSNCYNIYKAQSDGKKDKVVHKAEEYPYLFALFGLMLYLWYWVHTNEVTHLEGACSHLSFGMLGLQFNLMLMLTHVAGNCDLSTFNMHFWPTFVAASVLPPTLGVVVSMSLALHMVYTVLSLCFELQDRAKTK